jgi:uncharacterized protein YecT (DUF1311 family)
VRNGLLHLRSTGEPEMMRGNDVKSLPVIRVVVLLTLVGAGVSFPAPSSRAQVPPVGPGRCVAYCSGSSDDESGGGAALAELIRGALKQLLSGFNPPPIQPPPRLARPPAEQTTYNPTFKCDKTTAAAEDVVCADEGLSRLDRQLGAEYVRLLRKLDRSHLEELVYEERDWIAERDLCEDHQPCILQKYTQRIAKLRDRSARLERGCGASQWCCRHDFSQCHGVQGCLCTACCPK